MSNIAKLEFTALDISGENYMTWTTNVKRHMKAMGVLETINEGNDCSEQDKAKADIFIHKHIDELLKHEYFNFDDPYELWKDLKNRFDNQKEVLLPTAKSEWNSLRFQDFKKVNDYTSALFRICSKLEFCGYPVTEEEKLEKTYSTFHASNINLAQQYRLLKFYRYSELNAYLLVAEKHNELLMKNQETRPTGSLATPEANIVHNSHKKWENGPGQGRGRGRGQTHFSGYNHSNNKYNYGRGRGRGCGRSYGRGRSQRANNYHNSRNNNFNQQNKFKGEEGTSHNNGGCYRCGNMNHWSKHCRTPSHLCKLYQESKKDKEVNHVDKIDDVNTELTNSDFYNEEEH